MALVQSVDQTRLCPLNLEMFMKDQTVFRSLWDLRQEKGLSQPENCDNPSLSQRQRIDESRQTV